MAAVRSTGSRVVARRAGRVSVRVLPHTLFERLLYSGFEVDVWMPPGVEKATVRRRAGLAQRDPARTGGVGARPGRGQHHVDRHARRPGPAVRPQPCRRRSSSIPSPTSCSPCSSVRSRRLIEPGFLRIVTGGAEVGSELALRPAGRPVHMTGSARDARRDRVRPRGGGRAPTRRAIDRVLEKPISSELGGVSPTIVLPGKWSDRRSALPGRTRRHAEAPQRRLQLRRLAGARACRRIGSRSDAFLDAIRGALRERAPARARYYPGCEARMDRARTAYPAQLEELATPRC